MGDLAPVPGWRKVTMAIGRVTLTEILRDKILYNVLLCAFLLFALGLLAARLTFVHPERVVLDMGQSAVGISCAMIATFLGAGLIGREVERRTIHLALSRPISRAQFVLGKFVGISGVLALNWLLLVAAYLGVLCLMGGGLAQALHATVLAGLLLLLIQSVVIASVAIFFSTFSTTSLSAILCIGVYLVGHVSSELQGVVARVESPAIRVAGRWLVRALPDLEHFNLGFKVTYGLPVTFGLILESVGYGLALMAVFLVSASLFMERREI